jgi:hypothetical protein
MGKPHTVDVAINVYGKPLQTAVTLLSLLKHSGEWIDKVYFIEERRQPHGADFKFLLDLLGDRVIYYRPVVWWFVRNQLKWKYFFKIPFLRHTIRYQYGWEKSRKDYLLILHNDVYFKGDLVKVYLDNIEDHVGIGNIGQCWNCSASKAGLCNGESFTEYRPTYEQVVELFEQYPPLESRKALNDAYISPYSPVWPLPECRLNEYVAMVNLKIAAPLTWPKGKASPIGLFNYETGIPWFKDMVQQGVYPKHQDFELFATHGWASEHRSGHGALFHQKIYFEEEERARQVLKEEFHLNL